MSCWRAKTASTGAASTSARSAFQPACRGAWRWSRATPTAIWPTIRSGAFDYAILSQTLQQAREPKTVLVELLRIADKAIVSLPNFAHWRVRLRLLVNGRMPVTESLPEPWWSTQNIHLCTLRDFTDLCGELGVRINAAAALADGYPARPIDPSRTIENWRAEQAIFLLSRA